MKTVNWWRFCAISMGMLCSLASPLVAAESEGSEIPWYRSLDHSLSKKGRKEPLRLYNDSSNPVIQTFNVTLRAHYQGGLVNSHQGEHPGSNHSTSEWRRVRLGWNAELFHSVKMVNVWNLGGLDGAGYYSGGQWHDHRQAIGNLYDLHLEYAFEGGKISLGKTLPLMMMEYRQPSAIYTLPELPLLEEQLRSDNSYGASITATDSSKKWGYYFGVWSDTERTYRKAWGTWQSAFATTGISRDISGSFLEKGRVHLDWIYNFSGRDGQRETAEGESYVGTKARHVVALYYKGEEGPFILNLEAIGGIDLAAYKENGAVKEPSNVIGFVAMPGYMITPHVQVVLRGQWAKGNDGVLLMKRYSCLLPTQGSYVDEYKAVGLGFNFYLFPENKNRVKIMTMAEYGNSYRKSASGGFTGWTFIGGVYLDF